MKQYAAGAPIVELLPINVFFGATTPEEGVKYVSLATCLQKSFSRGSIVSLLESVLEGRKEADEGYSAAHHFFGPSRSSRDRPKLFVLSPFPTPLLSILTILSLLLYRQISNTQQTSSSSLEQPNSFDVSPRLPLSPNILQKKMNLEWRYRAMESGRNGSEVV